MSKTSQKIGELAKRAKTPCLQGSVDTFTAIEIMDIYEIDIIGVVCEDNFAGVFSRNDYNKNVIRQRLDPKRTTLYETMTLNAPYVLSDLSIKDTYDAMIAYQWEYMPVVEDQKLCGIVAMKDLGKDIMQLYEDAVSENRMIMNYIQGGESYAMSDYSNTNRQSG